MTLTNLMVYEAEMKRSSVPLLLLRTLDFFPLEYKLASEEIHSEDRKELGFQRKMTYFSLISQKLTCFTTITEKGTLLGNAIWRNQGKRSYGDNGRRNATTNEPSSQALVAQDGLGGYDWSNDFDEPVNYALMAISSSSSSSSSDNEVQNYSKQCLESFKTLQKNFDSEREKHSRARLEIQGYELALESLESRILGHEKNELAWGEKYEFQNYELKCREVKINNLKMELEKVVKERDELKVKIEKWEESSKGLNKLLNSQMSAKDKNGLGYGTQLDEISNKSETDSEISMSVFEVRSSDEEITPPNDRFSKADGYHVVPPHITGNFLTPRADISFADDEDDVSEVNIINPVKTNETQTVKTQVDKIGQISHKEGIGFKKIKACFVWWTNQYGIMLKGTALITLVKQNEKRAVHIVSTARLVSTARPFSTARPVSTVRPFSTARPVSTI
ncbi:hypothetical protein Tco_0836206 [Tanacetum coccineum]